MSFNNSGGYMDNSYDSSNTNAGSGYTKVDIDSITTR